MSLWNSRTGSNAALWFPIETPCSSGAFIGVNREPFSFPLRARSLLRKKANEPLGLPSGSRANTEVSEPLWGNHAVVLSLPSHWKGGAIGGARGLPIGIGSQRGAGK